MRHIHILLTTLIALTFAACEQPLVEDTMPEARMVEAAFVATTDSTRATADGNITRWEVGDHISVALVVNFYTMSYAEMEIKSPSDISADGKRATFRGMIPEGSYYGVTVIYPAQDIDGNRATLDRNAVDNMFMISSKSNNYYPILTATAGKPVELPIEFTHLMHKMDLKLSLASGYSSNDLDSNNIVVEVSATSNSTPMEFAQKQTLNIRTGTYSGAENATSFMIRGSKDNLSTMLFPLNTTRNMELTFGVYVDGEKRYEIVKGPFATFKMSAGKTTTVNLVLSNENSTTGGGEIVEEKIILSSSKSTIKANGTESATLQVMTEQGEDVTLQSELYVNSSKLNGTTFSTTYAGSYTFYAERNGVRSNEIVITAEAVTDTSKKIVFAEGVTLTSGWYDVNKVGAGDNGDINMCWAASASNIIQWWQDRYVEDGGTLPSTAVTGPGKDHYELALMDIYHSEWDNSMGGHVEQAIPWYFEGSLNGGEYATAGSQAVPKSAGGYWKSVWSSVVDNMYCGYDYFSYDTFDTAYTYTVCYNNYYLWGNGSSLTGTDRLKYYTDLVVTAFEHGMASMTISLASNMASLHHAITLWGYEIDNATGLLTRVWVTDSDDLIAEPKGQRLHEYSVSIGSGKSHIQLSCPNIRYKNVWVVDLVPVAGPNSK